MLQIIKCYKSIISNIYLVVTGKTLLNTIYVVVYVLAVEVGPQITKINTTYSNLRLKQNNNDQKKKAVYLHTLKTNKFLYICKN